MIKVDPKSSVAIPHIGDLDEYVILVNWTDEPLEFDFQLGGKFSIIEARSSDQKV